MTYGEYRVGSSVYVNKMDALAEHVKTGQPITWHLFEEELSRLDLKKEPEESLAELYAKRARELREEYDHLVVHFSGGTDTSAIINIFIENDIHVDELFIRTYDRETRHREFLIGKDPEGQEAEDITLPLAQHIKETYWPHITITHVDFSQGLIDRMKSDVLWYKDYRSCSIDPNSIMRSDWDMLVPRWRTMAERGLKIGHIVGKEKPRVRLDDVGFYIQYSDIDHQDYIAPRKLDLPYHIEMFFWHPSTVKMQLKQAHTLRRCWSELYSHHSPDRWFTRAYEDEIARAVYPVSRLPMLGFTLKRRDLGHLDTVWKQQSNWFIEDKQSDHFKIWSKGAFYLYDQVRSMYDNSLDFFLKGFPNFSTRKHYIT
jgi:hypothetical protein